MYLATAASKHCPRSGPRVLQLVRAFPRLSLVQASNRLSSPVSLWNNLTSTREWPESSSELSRLLDKGQRSAATGSSSLIGPVRAKQLESQRGKSAGTRQVLDLLSTQRRRLSRLFSSCGLARPGPRLGGWHLSFFREGREAVGRLRDAMAAFCPLHSLFVCAARHTPPTGALRRVDGPGRALLLFLAPR